MTARSKVTLVEAQQIRAHLIQVVSHAPIVTSAETPRRAVDALLDAGLIDTDAALRSALTPKNTGPVEP